MKINVNNNTSWLEHGVVVSIRLLCLSAYLWIAAFAQVYLFVGILLNAFVGLRYGFPAEPIKVVHLHVMELDPMEGIIDLHFDIMFFLIFVMMFVMWMLGTILVYYNSREPMVVKEAISFSRIMSTLKVIGKFLIAVAAFILYVWWFDEPTYARGNTPAKPIEPHFPFVTERTHCFKTFCTNFGRILSTKSTRVTSTVCEELFTYLANNPDHGRELAHTNPQLAKAFFSFVNDHCSKYVVLKPLQHTSFHTISSEIAHLVLWHDDTGGEVFFKVKKESILKGVDFVSRDGTIRVQAKTLIGAKATVNHVTGVIRNASSHQGINGVSVLVDNVQASEGAKKFVVKPPGALDHVIVANTESFSEQQAKWFCNSLAERCSPEAYDRITSFFSEVNWGKVTREAPLKVDGPVVEDLAKVANKSSKPKTF